jgi:hypothetical protein
MTDAVSPALEDEDGRSSMSASRVYVLCFFGLVVTCLGAFALVLAVLDRLAMLPPPPVTGTTCMDEKFKFLAERDLSGVDLVAVGSSVTWRNLDVAAFQRRGLARRPVNAAPCYLHVSEMVYYTDFLLSRMPDVQTVVSVVAPRDFERCTARREAFFPAMLAERYVFDDMTPFPIYLANLVPHRFMRDVLRIRQMRSDPNAALSLVMDEHGAGPMHTSGDWLPEPAFADMCFAALTELERIVTLNGARLIVATLPMQPQWRALYDPDGEVISTFEQRVRAALVSPTTLLQYGSQVAVQALSYGDAIHFVWDSAVRYSASLADASARTLERQKRRTDLESSSH